MSKKPQGQKSPRRAVAHHIRGYDPETATLYDKRGLFESTVGPGGYTVLKHGKPEPNAADEAGALIATARALVTEAGHPPPQTGQAAIDAEAWRNTIMAACGPGSPPALAAVFLYNLGIVKTDIENAALRPELKFSHIIQFAAAWHALKFEVSGDHELAFGKVQHVAGQTKGSQTTADKGAQRAAIVLAEIAKLRASGTSEAVLAKPAAIARLIRSSADNAFRTAGLSASASDSAFEQIVRRTLATD